MIRLQHSGRDDTMQQQPSPSYSYYANRDDDGYPHLYQKQFPPSRQQVPCSTGLLYSSTGGWYCPTAPCTGERPHDRARCDLHTGEWLTDTVGGAQQTYKNEAMQMQPCEMDWKQPMAPGTRGSAVCDQLTGNWRYDLSQDTVPTQASTGRSPYTGMHSSRTESNKAHSTGRGRDGMSNANLDVMNRTHRMQAGLAMDRAYQGRKGVPFTDGSGHLHPAQTGLSAIMHRQRGIFQRNSITLPLQLRHAEPAKKVLGPSPFMTARISKQSHLTNRQAPLTAADEASARGIVAGSGETYESAVRVHRGLMN